VCWFSLQLLFGTFLILRRIQRDVVINVKASSCKVPVILVWLWCKFNFLDRFSKKAQISNFIKIRPVGAELFHADRQRDGRTGMSKLIVAFRNFANAPKTLLVSPRCHGRRHGLFEAPAYLAFLLSSSLLTRHFNKQKLNWIFSTHCNYLFDAIPTINAHYFFSASLTG
jgi:hypothetical protein